ncbi:mast cell protease 2-like [Centropristis striata]|uniref:mast cell protease 2-like n=1 Tax=Centropristis striata TaxID=184440 RepID=UPI0027E00AE2|nr:mast cell protease 2-like [Centropristis striata]
MPRRRYVVPTGQTPCRAFSACLQSCQTPGDEVKRWTDGGMINEPTKYIIRLSLLLMHSSLGDEIINGTKTKEKSMLYMASVQNDGRHKCGGFLINENFVLTAAHCDFPKLSVVLGTHDLQKVDDRTMRYSVERCKHPSFVDVAKGDDIMLLKLTKKARLNKRLQPVQLIKPGKKVNKKEKCRVAGWGWTRTGGKVVNVLQDVDVSIVNLTVCKAEWSSISVNLPANVTCAGGYGTNKGFCQGDSGGPLVCSGKAVGVVSFNMKRNCDYPNLPNVYTDISKYLPWIKKVLKKKKCLKP